MEIIQTTVKIGKNTEKSPGDLRRLVFTQAPLANDGVENSQGVK